MKNLFITFILASSLTACGGAVAVGGRATAVCPSRTVIVSGGHAVAVSSGGAAVAVATGGYASCN